MIPFISLALAIALTYVIGDLYISLVPTPVAWGFDFIVCAVIYRLTVIYLKRLKE